MTIFVCVSLPHSLLVELSAFPEINQQAARKDRRVGPRFSPNVRRERHSRYQGTRAEILSFHNLVKYAKNIFLLLSNLTKLCHEEKCLSGICFFCVFKEHLTLDEIQSRSRYHCNMPLGGAVFASTVSCIVTTFPTPLKPLCFRCTVACLSCCTFFVPYCRN